MYWARMIDQDKPLIPNNVLLIVKNEGGFFYKTFDGEKWEAADEYADLVIGERAFEGDYFENRQLQEMINNIA